jgi:hypothetical protein
MIRNNIGYHTIFRQDLEMLSSFLEIELAKHNGVAMKISGSPRSRISGDGLFYAVFEVDSGYFKHREAISFQENGFVSITPWADEVNLVPFVNAMARWITWKGAQIARRESQNAWAL